MLVVGLNYVHHGLRWISLEELGREPSKTHRAIYRRLMALVTVCDTPGEFPLPPGRGGFEFVACMTELEKFVDSYPHFEADSYSCAAESAEPIGRIEPKHAYVSDREFSPTQPYRSLRADRLKLTGRGEWPMEEHIDTELWLPFVEPLILKHGRPFDWPGPQFKHESYVENLKLARVWDARGLLALFSEPPELACRVFNAHKSELVDRQIGDRRFPNGAELHPRGPSYYLPSGPTICSIHCPRGMCLRGSVSDRKDFYHQAAVTRARAFSNCLFHSFPVSEFSSSQALQTMYSIECAPTKREFHGDRLGMEPRSILSKKHVDKVYAGFNSLFQGDHLGVEYALVSHTDLLQQHGLLSRDSHVLRHTPFPRGPLWQGLVIDDFFAVSCEKGWGCFRTVKKCAMLRNRRSCICS